MIKISIERPQLPDDSTLSHSGTSWQISRIPDFTDRSYYLAEELNDTINLLEYLHNIDLDKNEAVYCRVRYHFNTGVASGWSRVIPVKSGQIGLKMSGDIVMTPRVKVTVDYINSSLTNLILETSDMAMYSGVGDHESTTWSITDTDNNIIWTKELEIRDKLKIEVSSEILEQDKIYFVKAVHHTNTNAHSNSGKALLSTNINKSNIFELKPIGPLVPDRLLYFKLFVYVNKYESVDIIIRNSQGVQVASNLNQLTRTPKILAAGLIPYQRYTIYGRIKYDNGTYSKYVEIDSYIVENNTLISSSDTAGYLDKYSNTQELRLGGEVVSTTTEIYTNDILMTKANDNNVYRHVMCGDKIVDKGPVLSLDGLNELMDKPYINIIPLHNGRILIDYNANRVVHIDSPLVPESVRTHMINNKLDKYVYELITIVADKPIIATDDIYGDELTHRPRFSLYEFNTVTYNFTLLKTVTRDDELFGTSVNNSLVVMNDSYAYYIPTHSVVGLENNTLTNLTLKKINLNNLSISLVKNLPVDIKSHPTLFKGDNNTLFFMSGSGEPTMVDNIAEFSRINNSIYRFSIPTDTWYDIGVNMNVIPNTMYSLAPYVRLDGKVVLFNNSNSGVSRGDQRTGIFDPVTNDLTLSDNDTIDDLTYRNTIQLLNGDLLRISTRVLDPQLVQTYVKDTYSADAIHINDTIDVINDLVVKVGDVVTVETLYKFNSIKIEGDSDTNTGKLILLDGNSITEFKWNDLIVIGDISIEQDLYLGTKSYNSITILEGSSLEVYNVLHVPDDTSFAITGPISVNEMTIGENSNLVIDIP
jgi:hypothetical protein